MCPFLLLGFSFSCFLERSERFIPESVEPPAERFDALCFHRIEPTCTLGAVHHQSRPLENLQVLRNGGTGHGHPVGNFPHRAGTTAQTLEHRPSGRISQCIENLLYVSFH
jgi:hypothetical protein